MLKILQARLQQYVNRELPDVQAGFRREWQPTPVFLLVEFHRGHSGLQSMGLKESDTTERLHFTSLLWDWNEN